MKRRHEFVEGVDKFILMVLFREGPQTLLGLREKVILFISQVWYEQWREKESYPVLERCLLFFSRLLNARRQSDDRHMTTTTSECDRLTQQGLIRPTAESSLELTEAGREAARAVIESMEATASSLNSKVFSASAAAKVAVFVDFVLAVLKLGVGLLTGSAGLIADGVDATVDTVSAFAVWLGIRVKKEYLSTLVVIFMLFVGGFSAGYEAVSKIIDLFRGTLEPISMPYLVIAAEVLGLAAALLLFYYQRFVGRSRSSLTIISQSVDSKNHAFIAMGVILGAILSLNGIHFADAVIGLVIAVRITKDAIDLLKDAIFAMKGSQADLSRYKTPFGDWWTHGRRVIVRIWTLFVIENEGLRTRDEILTSLKRAFTPGTYIPVLTELETIPREDLDFGKEFDHLLEALVKNGLLNRKGEDYVITDPGRAHLYAFAATFSHYDVGGADSVLLSLGKKI
jgi:cation diffusion facilitator family transporter